MRVDRLNRSTDEWEQVLGARLRAVRIEADLNQRELAEAADVSLGAVQNLEGGKGSSINTLVKVLRALDRTDWIESLAPEVTISPMSMWRSHRKGGSGSTTGSGSGSVPAKPRQRVSRRRG